MARRRNLLSVSLDNREQVCHREDMALLSDEFADHVERDVLTALAWRAMWLHAAITGRGGGALAPRALAALTLVATSVFGVDVGAVARHLRRFGTGDHAARSTIQRLVSAGYLSLAGDRADLPLEDLAWIRAHLPSR